jgi:hypothetical protein
MSSCGTWCSVCPITNYDSEELVTSISRIEYPQEKEIRDLKKKKTVDDISRRILWFKGKTRGGNRMVRGEGV